MKRIALIIYGWLALMTAAQSASFDCAKASTNIEKIICANDQLSKFDDELSKLYQDALAKSSYEAAVILKAEQQDWLKNVRSICSNTECIESAYRVRVNILKGVDSAGGDMDGNRFRLITKPSDVATLIKDANDHLNGIGIGRINFCSVLVETPVPNSHGNASYGAICNISNRQRNYDAMLCANEMIGTFAMKYSFSLSNKEAMKFTLANCMD